MYFKFNETDIFRNTIVTYPRFECKYHANGSDIYFVVNNQLDTGTMRNIPSDGISVLEKNIDRASNLIRPFIGKTDGDTWIQGLDSGSFSLFPFGESLTGTYSINKTVAKDYIDSLSHPMVDVLRYAWNKQRMLSAEFDFDEFPIPCSYHALPRELYGSGIKKGSIEAGLVISDESVPWSGYAVAQDLNKDGILRLTADSLITSSLVGQRVGYVLYDEGLILFHSASVQVQSASSVWNPQYTTQPEWMSGSGDLDQNWLFFGDNDITNASNYSFLNFQGTRRINNLTMMCTAPARKLNISNNPTFLEKDQNIFMTQSSDSTFMENAILNIKNIVSSSFNVTEPFNKESYITEVYVYDEHKNVIGIAKLANPLRKRESDEFTIKISYDI